MAQISLPERASIEGDQKLSVLARKSLRDDWQPQRLAFEAKLGKALSPGWQIDVDIDSLVTTLYGKGQGGDGKLGYDCCLHASRAVDAIEDWTENEDVKDEVDQLFPAKRLVVKTDADCDTLKMEKTADGSFAVTVKTSFKEPESWADRRLLSGFLDSLYPSWKEVGGLSAAAKRSMRVEYEPNVEKVRRDLAETLQMPNLTLDPNVEAVFTGVTVSCRASGNADDDWTGASIPQKHDTFGRYVYLYFQQLAERVKKLGFQQDEMLREGFADKCSTHCIGLRVLLADQMRDGRGIKYRDSMATFEDGKLWISVPEDSWGVNISQTGNRLIDNM